MSVQVTGGNTPQVQVTQSAPNRVEVSEPTYDVEIDQHVTKQVATPAEPQRVTTRGAGVKGDPGRQGDQGEPGAQGVPGNQFTRIAARPLSAHRVVTPQPDGTVDYADPSDITQSTWPMWLTLTAVGVAGQEVVCIAAGKVYEAGWSWAPGAPVFLGLAGVLTQTPPTSADGYAFMEQVASPDTTTDLFYDPRTPIGL